MKGLSVWIWIIGGFIVGIIMFSMFIQLLSYINLSKDREFAKENFGTIVESARSVCESREGTKVTRIVSFPELVKGVYSTNETRFITKTERGLGKYICLQFEKDMSCEEINCEVEMSTIKPEKNLLNLISRITGGSGYTDFTVKITKTVCGVSILLPGQETECVGCDYTCNAICAKQCESEPDYPENDPDCKRKLIDTFWCEGDRICDRDRGENCGNSKDCPPSQTNLPENSVCACDAECASGLKCTDNHCCPEGKKWDGTKCVAGYDALIVALKSRLKSVYTDDQISQLENKIEIFIQSLRKDGLYGGLLYLDEDKTSDLTGGVKVTSPGDWNNIDGVLDILLPKVKAKYLFIIGGYQTFPQAEVSVGICDDPFFNTFQTDDLYADYSPKDNMPEIPVGRIPDPTRGDISLLLNALDTYISLHNSGGLDLSDKFSIVMERAFTGCPVASSGICFNRDAFNINCFSALCMNAGTSYTQASGHKLFSLLVHGDFGNPQPFADDQCNTGRLFMRSTHVSSLDVRNSVWMMMPCYSSYIKNKQQSSDSVPMEFLKNGGAVYFGGTLTQMGGVMSGGMCPSIPGGDSYIGTLYTLVAREFSVGKTIGEAYLSGKVRYNSIVPDTEECKFRQLHENQLYGDPTLKIKNV